MKKSVLTSHKSDLLQLVRKGYSQRMLLLYLRREKFLTVSQPCLSRWLSKHRVPIDLPQDEQFHYYKTISDLHIRIRTHSQTLTRVKGYVELKRSQGASLSDIQEDLCSRGIVTSIRSIRRALGAR